jgi:organic radical activating enzyme
MTVKNKKYFCYEIYKNLAIWSTNGKLSYNPCSFYNGYINTSHEFDLANIWNSPEHNQLKSLIEHNKPIPGCASCYKAEEHGLVSRRLSAKQLYEEYFKDTNIELDGPQSIDYSVGNLCNLKCVICGPHNSSAWVSDYQKIYPNKNIEKFKYDKFNQLTVDDSSLLKNIKNVHFHGGGEPLLSNNHINLLNKIKEVKGLADVHVFYNTNGTVKASQELLNLWAECKLVELYFSIDDIDERFNYQRTNAQWTELIDNLTWYKENMPVNHMFKINCVWGYLNLFYLNQIVDWHKIEFNTNRLGDPIELIFQKAQGTYSLDFVSTEVKNILIEKFRNYPTILELVNTLTINDSKQHTIFFDSIHKIDAVRRTQFEIICPEWNRLLIPN